MSEIANFYRRPGPTSDLGRHRGLVPGLPADVEALGEIVRGVLIHTFEVKMRGLPLSDDRMSHAQTAGAEAIAAQRTRRVVRHSFSSCGNRGFG
jgi:hypothetical protein